MNIDLTKPTIVILRSLPRSGSHLALMTIQSFLEEQYKDSFQQIDCKELFEVNHTDPRKAIINDNGVITQGTDTFLDPKQEVQKRIVLLSFAVEQKKSFAFKLFYGNDFNKTALRYIDTIKDAYNVVYIDLFRKNVLDYMSSVMIARNKEMWVYDENTKLNNDSFEVNCDFFGLDHQVMFTYFKYTQAHDLYDLKIIYEDMKDDPAKIVELFAERGNFNYIPETLKTPYKKSEIISNYDEFKETISKILDRYEINYDSDLTVDPYADIFDINRDVPGWTDYDKLFYLAKMTKGLTGKKLIVEIGSLFGRSAYVLAHNRKSKNITVSCFDFFPSDPNKTLKLCEMENRDKFLGKYGPEDRYDYKFFLNNIGEADNFNTYPGNFNNTSAELKDDSVYMVFIDGDHSYEGTKKNLDTMWKKIDTAHAIIVVDDYISAFPGSVDAIEEFAGKHSLDIEDSKGLYNCPSLAIMRVTS